MADINLAPTAEHDRLTIHHGLRTAVAAGLSYWFAQLLHLPGDYWAAISSIIVMQSEVGATLIASRDRFVGTAIGAVVGWIIAKTWHGHIVIFALGIFVVIVTCTLLRFKNSGRLGGVTVAIIVLIAHTAPTWHIALERFVEVSLGIVVSLAVVEVSSKVGAFLRQPKT